MKKTTTILLICLNVLLIQTASVSAQTERKLLAKGTQMLKLDSIVISNFSKYEYAYNEHGQLLRERFYVATDSVRMIYTLMKLTECNYENEKKISTVNTYLVDGVWKIFDRNTYKYENDKLSVDTHESFFSNQWNIDKKADYIYGANKLLSGIEYSVLINGNFKQNEKAAYNYDPQSNQLLNIVNKILKQDNKWVDKTKTEFVYESGNLSLQTDFVWSDTIRTWRPTDRKEYVYNNTNPKKVTYKESYYTNNGFVTTIEKEITLDSSCPTENLVLPVASNLPFKVQAENTIGASKTSAYFYSEFSGTGIPKLTDAKDVVIYPNPARNTLNVQSNQTINRVEIFDISGKLLAIYLSSFDKLDISGLAKAAYYVKVSNAIHDTTLKLIKE